MEYTEIEKDRNYDQFFDAVEESSLMDCNGEAESGEPAKSLKHEIVEDGAINVLKAKHSSLTTLPGGLRRRHSFRLKRQGNSANDDKDKGSDSSVISEVTDVSEPPEKTNKIVRAFKDHEKVSEISDSSRLHSSSGPITSVREEDTEDSAITSANNEHADEPATGDSHVANPDEASSSFLIFLVGLVIKAVGFQFSILFRFFFFPIWLSYYSFLFVIDPFRTTRWAKRYLTTKLFGIWGFFWGSISQYIFERLKGHKIGTLIARFGCGLFWSVYVCMILCGLLVLAFVMGGFMMRYIVEEPIHLTKTLSFDYTKSSPVAYVPITHCPDSFCGSDCKGEVRVKNNVGSRLIPSNHKFEIAISLTLPESDYNRKLGVFQVRVDFLSANGRVISSLSYPCMLRFKSEPIHYLETFLKTAPLVAGYSSESQTLNLKMSAFTEEKEPTACLRVVLEQRAEYRPGAGIPELYDASLVLDSELPLLKRFIWGWKKTVFIWISMSLLLFELMMALVCCRPILIPRAKPRTIVSTANNSSRQNKGIHS